MNKLKVSTITMLAVLLMGCKEKSSEELFTKVLHAESKVIIDEEKTLDPDHINIVDSFLIIGNSKQNPLIEVYNISSGECINKFLHAGDGPDEVLMIGSIQYNPLKKELLVADLFKRKIFSYKFEDIISVDNPKPTMLYNRGENSPLMFDKLYTGNQCLIAESRDPRGRILLLNKDGGEGAYYLEYPKKEMVDEKLSDFNNANLYASAIAISPTLDKIALATYEAGMIDICKIEANGIIPQWNYTAFYPQETMIVPMGDSNAVALTPKSRNGFTSIDSSDKYIYALFSGKLLEDPSYPYGSEVYVVSWDGKETYKITLDKSVNRLAVDAKDEFMYGITPEMEIVRFNILKKKQ